METRHKKNVTAVAELMHCQEGEKKRLLESRAVTVLGLYPYLTDCKTPDLVARAEMVTYLTADRNPLFDHRPGESLATRLQPVCGGGGNVVKAASKVLEILSLGDHKKDLLSDKEAGKYNPLGSFELDYEKEKARIMGEIKSIKAGSTPNEREGIALLEEELPTDSEPAWY